MPLVNPGMAGGSFRRAGALPVHIEIEYCLLVFLLVDIVRRCEF